MTPRHQKNPQPMVTKICVGDCVGDIYHHPKFYPNRFRGFGSAHLRVISRPLAQSDSATVETRAPILTHNTSNDAIPRKEVPFGVAKPKSKVWTPIFPQNAIFGPHFDGTIFSLKNGFSIGRIESSALLCSSAVLDPRVGHAMDVLSPFIPVLCHSD